MKDNRGEQKQVRELSQKKEAEKEIRRYVHRKVKTEAS